MTGEDRLRRAYEEGFAAARRGEEAAPGCTVTDEGRAWLRGYVEGAASGAGEPGRDVPRGGGGDGGAG